MVYVLLTISERANRMINMVKARYGLRTKSEAVEKVIMDYVHDHPEFFPQLDSQKSVKKKQKR